MKYGKLVINIVKLHLDRYFKKVFKDFKMNPNYKYKENVPYNNDGNFYHQFDIVYAKENRKNVCVIDFHGGGYIIGSRKNNHQYGEQFLREGYDFISMDYVPNTSKSNMRSIFDDCLDGLEYIINHLKELEIQYNRFIFTGDSAGGHIALLMSEIVRNKEFAKNFKQNVSKINLLATLVNCPVFNYYNLGDGMLTNSGKRRLMGKNFKDMELRKLLDPKSHIDCLDVPLFLSTTRYDFIRNESVQADEMLKGRKDYIFIDVNSDNKAVAHVHNIVNPNLEESKYINNEMIKFMNSVSK